MINKILDRLYVGDSDYDQEDLDEYNIHYIINLGGHRTQLEHKHIHLRDNGGNDYSDIQKIVAFIQQKIFFGSRVLVHCRAGISRSPYIIVKYLECIGFNLFDAIEYVKMKHPITQINQELLDTIGWEK